MKRGKKLPEVQKDIIVSKLQQKINRVSIFVENKKAPLCGAFYYTEVFAFFFFARYQGKYIKNQTTARSGIKPMK